MKELYHKISEYAQSEENMVLTVLEGDNLGEKAVVSDGRVIWESENQGFFTEHFIEVEKLEGSGISEIANCRIFVDTLAHEKHIVICGGGHVSMPIIQIGVMMGCNVTVLEDRPLFADNARKAGATKVICDSFANGLNQIEGNADTYFVIVTRGHRYDQVCLEKIAQKEHAYIGMIGSRRRVNLVKQMLIENGSDKEVLDAVYTPIGLDIGAETPVEIAVAIMAEIIEVKNRKKRTFGFPKEIIKAILDDEKYPQKKVLATIVERKGSAPQDVGVKMLILPDGKCVGTIGGGCMEAKVLQKGRIMALQEETKAMLCKVDMTGTDAEDEGMVCGGMVDVLLEVIE